MNADELKAYGRGVESLSDRQVFFLAVMLTSLSETLRATVESGMAEIKAEIAELRRAVGGGGR
ncbi:MAG TPA: hypothetical protein PK250_18500 [Syntrophobacter fumaroxidans]|nr:hypothetical protein [Syntrophobacter fumaroxidans]